MTPDNAYKTARTGFRVAYHLIRLKWKIIESGKHHDYSKQCVIMVTAQIRLYYNIVRDCGSDHDLIIFK